MSGVKTSQPFEDATSGATKPTIKDDTYLLTLVDVDALFPATLTMTGLFDGESEFNADELSDIASLLAPQVSDDDEASSETNSPMTVRTMSTLVAESVEAAVNGAIAILPSLNKSPGEKRSLVLQGATTDTSQKKAKNAHSKKRKTTQTRKVTLKPKPAASISATTPVLSLSSEPTAPNPLSANDARYPTLPTLAPKPAMARSLSDIEVTEPCNSANSSSIEADFAFCDEDSAVAADTRASSKYLTEDERAKQCRDRNREHARNTRLRKKAFVEELKTQLREMVDERDAALLEAAQKVKIVEQQREVRFQVMQDFLQLRGRNEGNPQRWGAIMEDGFSLTLPKATFQTMVRSTEPLRGGSTQTLHGVPDIMADSTYFATFLHSLANRTHPTWDDTHIPINFVYQCDRTSFLMDGCHAVLNWTGTSAGAVKAGAIRELELSGSMRARFCSQTNRLEQAQIQFDTGLVHCQL